MNPCKISRARPSDASLLTSLALEAKRHWGYPDHWMDLWTDALSISSEYIAQHHVYLAEVDSVPLGFYALMEGTPWVLDHLWVRPGRMRQGLGKQLFQHAAAQMHKSAPGATLGIEADPNAEQFYIRMGARKVREIRRNWEGLIRVLPYLVLTPGELEGHQQQTKEEIQ